ncbi:Hypothetical protein HVR_LOCUS166 [uncultured virus]|nr:Hypothetical protein HVR_LOCUS166 [uncultured virus]
MDDAELIKMIREGPLDTVGEDSYDTNILQTIKFLSDNIGRLSQMHDIHEINTVLGSLDELFLFLGNASAASEELVIIDSLVDQINKNKILDNATKLRYRNRFIYNKTLMFMLRSCHSSKIYDELIPFLIQSNIFSE